jgi:hypothetical protein
VCRLGYGHRMSPRGGFSVGGENLTQNWYGEGESDSLIKTKHCDGPCGC